MYNASSRQTDSQIDPIVTGSLQLRSGSVFGDTNAKIDNEK